MLREASIGLGIFDDVPSTRCAGIGQVVLTLLSLWCNRPMIAELKIGAEGNVEKELALVQKSQAMSKGQLSLGKTWDGMENSQIKAVRVDFIPRIPILPVRSPHHIW